MIDSAARGRLLSRMGVTVYVPRAAPETGRGPAPVPPAADRGRASAPAPRPVPDPGFAPDAAAPPGAGGPAAAPGAETAPAHAGRMPVSALPWPDLENAVASCVACPLHLSRRRTVFGTGARDADWIVIGEGPGANEDRQGEPFVGRAGRLLNAMLLALGLAREEVFITNTVKCRPPGNRDPEPAETERCGPFLDRQIDLVEPRVVLAVGRVAAQIILDTNAPLSRLRGRVHRYPRSGRHVPVVATYHPAYLLRKPSDKRAAWEDLCLARSIAVRSP